MIKLPLRYVQNPFTGEDVLMDKNNRELSIKEINTSLTALINTANNVWNIYSDIACIEGLKAQDAVDELGNALTAFYSQEEN